MKKLFFALTAILALTSAYADEVKPLELNDKIRSIQEVRYGQRILFQKHAAIYKLKTTSPNYDKIHDALLEAQEKKKSISLKTDPYTMEILELNSK